MFGSAAFLPVQDPGRLVLFEDNHSYPAYRFYVDHNPVFSGIIASASQPMPTSVIVDRDAEEAQVLSDVDSAYASLSSNVALLQPYKQKYLQQAERVRDTVAFAYQHGGASLLDFLNAQSEYRNVQLSYVNLIGSYLTAASQLNLAVGREVVQ